MSDLEKVRMLIKLKQGDQGNVEHVKRALELDESLFESDKAHLQQVIDENITDSEKTVNSELKQEFYGKYGISC